MFEISDKQGPVHKANGGGTMVEPILSWDVFL